MLVKVFTKMSFEIISLFVMLHLALGATTGPTNLAREVTLDSTDCGAGKFDDVVTASCQPCTDDTFMTAEMAAKGGQHACALCQRPDTVSYEILAEPCTKTKDSIILCDKSHYRKNGSSSKDSVCTPCGQCGVGTNSGRPYLKAPCHDYTDTVCCESDDMVVENGKCLRPIPFHPRQTGNTRTTESTNRTTDHIMRTTDQILKTTVHTIKENEQTPGTTVHIRRTTDIMKSQRNNGVILVSKGQIALGTFLLCLFVSF